MAFSVSLLKNRAYRTWKRGSGRLNSASTAYLSEKIADKSCFVEYIPGEASIESTISIWGN